MLFRNVYYAGGVDSSVIEAGGRHDTESSSKMCTPGLFLRNDHGKYRGAACEAMEMTPNIDCQCGHKCCKGKTT
jgi:hypothetical protein